MAAGAESRYAGGHDRALLLARRVRRFDRGGPGQVLAWRGTIPMISASVPTQEEHLRADGTVSSGEERAQGRHVAGRDLGEDRLAVRRQAPGASRQRLTDAPAASGGIHLDADLQATGQAPTDDHEVVRVRRRI